VHDKTESSIREEDKGTLVEWKVIGRDHREKSSEQVPEGAVEGTWRSPLAELSQLPEGTS